MSNTLFLRLSSTLPESYAEALEVCADGSSGSMVRTGSLAELCANTTAKRVVVLIPGGEALVTRARLPKLSRAKLRQSLPFALEDQLIGEIDAQHFAVGTAIERAANDGVTAESTTRDSAATLEVPVVVIARRRLAEWIETLRAAGVTPSAVYLEDSCVAAKPGDVLGWFRHDEVFLRSPTGAGCVSRLEDLSAACDLLLADLPRQTLGLQCIADAKSRRGGETACAAVAQSFARLTWIDSAESAELPWLVSQLDLAAPINLLQGEFTPARQWMHSAQRWRLPTALAAVLLILVVVDQGLSWGRSSQVEAALDAALLNAAATVRPELTSIEAVLAAIETPRSQLEGASLLQQGLADLVSSGLSADSLRSIAVQGSVLRVVISAEKWPADATAALDARGWRIDVAEAQAGGSTLTLSRKDRDPRSESASVGDIARKQQLIAALPAALDRLQRRTRLGETTALPLASLARRLTEKNGVQAILEPNVDGSLSMTLSNVTFDSVLELQADFMACDVILRQARIDASGAPGRVEVLLVLGPSRT